MRIYLWLNPSEFERGKQRVHQCLSFYVRTVRGILNGGHRGGIV